MNILIVTQAVDRTHPILGFFHGWVEELAKQYEQVSVICLEEGEHELPENVTVHSLGKELLADAPLRRLYYVIRFYRHIRALKDRYDLVLVHMNPEYVILGGLLWKLWKKRVTLWYNHPKGGIRLWLAVLLSRHVLHTSPYAASARYVHKALRMPVGVDTELFAPAAEERNRNAIYMQGRISPSKRVHLMLEAMRLLRAKGIPATLTLVGPEDEEYAHDLRGNFPDLLGSVHFIGPYPNAETPALYRAHGVAVNLAAAGHFDKTAFEAMAAGTPVVVASPAYLGLIPSEWIARGNAEAVADAIERLITLPDETYEALSRAERATVAERHSLSFLMEKLPKALY